MMNNQIETGNGAPLPDELELINKQSRRELSAEEVYVFSVVLCDNEIDRDFERFTIDALNKLEKLYVGKTGIFDHSMKGRDQVARIISCSVEKVENQTTSDGQPYYRLKARAYMPKSKQNEDIILEIDSGIKREVSVGCSVAESKCSICGSDRKNGGCAHLPGRRYMKKGRKELCYTLLDNPTDAYEWSFVAVPAQPLAGVVKSFAGREEEKEMPDMNLLKSCDANGEVRLTAGEVQSILEYISQMEGLVKKNGETRDKLIKSVVSVYGAALPGVSAETIEAAMKPLKNEEIKSFLTAAGKGFGMVPAAPQLCDSEAERKKHTNDNFII